ncbi:hypothetical protein Ancab_004941 [Ancistrocladus abbreviatus]
MCSSLSSSISILPTPFKSGNYRKIPVTNKFNFVSIISGHRNCEITSSDNFILLRRIPNLPVFLYNDGISATMPMAVAPNNWYPGSEYLDYASRMKILERERERYLMSLNLNSNVYLDFNIYGGKNFYSDGDRMSDDGALSSKGERERMMKVCDVCMNYSKMMMEEDGTHEMVPFHWCKLDAMMVGFPYPANPIARPSKSEL